MTLHEAIETVLKSKGGCTSRQIADEINRLKLYSRNDNQPVPTSQISARVNKYPHLFSREDNIIKLK